MGILKPTPAERSAKVKNIFTGALKEFRSINEDIEKEQTEVKAKIETLHNKDAELSMLKAQNNTFVDKLSQFFEL